MSQRTRAKTKNTKSSGNARASGFDKLSAIRVVDVPVAGVGVYNFPDDVATAERVWVEWLPSAALEGKHRRMFISKQNVVDPSVILTDGGKQVPRKGMSCALTDRKAVVFGPGKMKIWVASERRTAQAPATGRELPSQLLQLVAPNAGNNSSHVRSESRSSASVTPSRR
uniref:Isoleucine--tRNA ligase n=1 Tax=Anthurium amnicola TaxID=1678845 RepID=A0A1D1Y0Z4_9ARAE